MDVQSLTLHLWAGMHRKISPEDLSYVMEKHRDVTTISKLIVQLIPQINKEALKVSLLSRDCGPRKQLLIAVIDRPADPLPENGPC